MSTCLMLWCSGAFCALYLYLFVYILFIPVCFMVGDKLACRAYDSIICAVLLITCINNSTLGIKMQYLFYIFFYILLNAYICIIPLNKALPQEKRPHIRPCSAFYKLGMTLYTSLLKIFNVAKYHNNRGK